MTGYLRCWTRLVAVLCLVMGPVTGWTASLVARESAQLSQHVLRVVSLDDLSTELLVSLGMAPVAVANLDGYRRYVRIGNAQLVDSVPLGSPQQPDLEAIARLKPDLIVGVSYLHLQLFKRLDALAPTLIFNVSLAPSSWDGVTLGESMLRRLSELTGRQAQAAQVIAKSQAALVRARLAVQAQGLSGRPLAVLYPLSREGSFIVSNQQALIVSVVNRLDITEPWRLDSAYSLHQRIGLRDLAAQTDLTVLFIGGQEGAPMFATPVWKAMPVARSGRVAFLSTPYWTFGGPLSVVHLADQIHDAVLSLPGMPP